jgi:hypothetical protein
MTRHQHLKAFNEAIFRCKLIRRDLDKINCNLEDLNYKKNKNLAEYAYIKTIEEIISRGKKYLSLNVEADESIRVALDIQKYQSILDNIN